MQVRLGLVGRGKPGTWMVDEPDVDVLPMRALMTASVSAHRSVK